MPGQHFRVFPLPFPVLFHDGNLSQQPYVRRQRRERENHSLKGDRPEVLSLNCLGIQFHILGKTDANIYSNSMQMHWQISWFIAGAWWDSQSLETGFAFSSQLPPWCPSQSWAPERRRPIKTAPQGGAVLREILWGHRLSWILLGMIPKTARLPAGRRWAQSELYAGSEGAGRAEILSHWGHSSRRSEETLQVHFRGKSYKGEASQAGCGRRESPGERRAPPV